MKIQQGIKQINKLIEAIEGTDVTEVGYDESGLSVELKRLISETKEDPSEKAESSKPADKNIIIIESHSVGIYRDGIYRENALPSRKNLSKIGMDVKKGQKIGFIESMKIMKELVTPVNGKIVEKYIKNGDPVEYGQKLFGIEIV